MKICIYFNLQGQEYFHFSKLRYFYFSFLSLQKITHLPISVLISWILPLHFHLNKMKCSERFEFKMIKNLPWCCTLHPLLYCPANFRYTDWAIYVEDVIWGERTSCWSLHQWFWSLLLSLLSVLFLPLLLRIVATESVN